MQKSERSSYTPLDFVTWREAKILVVTPKFQRRGVWTAAARSFLIDTMLRGMPIPPIFLRVTQSEDKKRIVREVVDGQQRVSAVLDFIDDQYALSRAVGGSYAGKSFSKLSPSEQDTIRSYSFICEVFHGVSDAEVLDIFARVNSYSVPLNAQELRNGRYFGYFKQTAYSLAHEHIEFWRRHGIFTERTIARMLEVELTSELMIAQLDGMQDKKKSLDDFYAQYDDEFKAQVVVEKRFRAVVDGISESMGEGLRESEFRRVPLFYSLFCTVFHRMFGLPKENLQTPKKELSGDERRALQDTVKELSDVIAAAREGQAVAAKHTEFVNACLRQTDNIQPRRKRFRTVYEAAF
jgi:hypothetical protein